MLQNGRDRGTAAAERPRRVVGFVGGTVNGSDGGQTQRSARHPGDVVQAPRLFIASSWSESWVGWTRKTLDFQPFQMGLTGFLFKCR